MEKWHYIENEDKKGPFTIEELRDKKINKKTLVWTDTMKEWEEAGNVPLLKDVIIILPPPTPKEKSEQNNNSKAKVSENNSQDESKQKAANQDNKSNKFGRILQSIGLIGAIIIVLIIIGNMNKSDSVPRIDQTYQEKVMTIEEMEHANPAKFLDAEGKYETNFWGDAFKIHGSIANNATVANYKDVLIEVIFYSKTNTKLDSKCYKIYDYFPSHSTKTFELKIAKPHDSEKIGLKAINASPVFDKISSDDKDIDKKDSKKGEHKGEKKGE